MDSKTCKWTLFVIYIMLAFASETCAEEMNETMGRQTSCGKYLHWVPPITKEPYITFLNKIHCPSWTTKHYITKENHHTHLTLTRGLPFAFYCGVCYTPSSHENLVSLTHRIVGHQAKLLTNVINVKNYAGEMEHRKGFHECQIVYGLTDYMADSGELTCSATFGNRTMTEVVTYYLDDPEIVAENSTVIVANLQETVTLTCPSVEEIPTNPSIHVWFHPLSGTVSIASPTTSPTVTLQLQSEPMIVACATYHLYRSKSAAITTFIIGTEEFINATPESLAKAGDFSDWRASNKALNIRSISYFSLFASVMVSLHLRKAI